MLQKEDMPEQLEIKYGTTVIPFELVYADRETLNITVEPNLSVRVKAPHKATLAEIKNKMSIKARWIVRQWEYFEQFLPQSPPKEYVPGESHYYLGKQYRLKIIKSPRSEVKMKGRYLVIYTPEKDNRIKIKLQLAGWYRQHAIDIFNWRIEQNLERLKKFQLGNPPLYVRRMEKRWGSCTPSGKITLNPEIIKAPVKCIDYVIIHELCHLIHHNHSSDFYKLQSKVMPDWERWKEKLDGYL